MYMMDSEAINRLWLMIWRVWPKRKFDLQLRNFPCISPVTSLRNCNRRRKNVVYFEEAIYYDVGMQKLLSRYHKCIDKGGSSKKSNLKYYEIISRL